MPDIKCVHAVSLVPLVHLDYKSGSKVLIRTCGCTRQAQGCGEPLGCGVIEVQGALVAPAGSLPRFPLTFNRTRKGTSKVFRAISTNCWTAA